MKALSLCGQEFGALNFLQKKFWDTITPADDLQLDAALPEFFGFDAKVCSHQSEDALNFLRGAAPIV
jgi:hypothetical protein